MKKTIKEIIEDALLIIGIVLISTGAFLIYVPAGFIVLGICILAFAYFFAKGSD